MMEGYMDKKAEGMLENKESEKPHCKEVMHLGADSISGGCDSAPSKQLSTDMLSENI